MKRILVATVLFASACAGAIGGGDGTATQSLDDTTEEAFGEAFQIQTSTVCFVAHNGADPTPVTITGTLYKPFNFGPGSSFVLLAHGAASNRGWWNGGAAGPSEAGSVGRFMATLSFATVAIDKIGYGDSPYVRGPGAGFSITPMTQVGMLHEVVTQLREGSYTVTSGGCPSGVRASFPAHRVALMAHSIGGGESMNYAGTYHDIDAVIPIAWTNQGLPSTVMKLFGENVIPQAMSGHDYVYFFTPGANGISQECIDSIFYTPGADPDVYNTQCANKNLGATPTGELVNAQALIGANLAAIHNVGPTPALLIFGDHDKFVTGPNNDTGDPDLQGPEINYWKQNCGCSVSSWIQPFTGHAEPLHFTNRLLSWKAATWLHSLGL